MSRILFRLPDSDDSPRVPTEPQRVRRGMTTIALKNGDMTESARLRYSSGCCWRRIRERRDASSTLPEHTTGRAA